MSEVHEILKQIQKAEYSLKHVNQRQYKDFIDHKQELDILIQNLSGFLRFKDNNYCVNFILHLQNLSTDRERRDVLRGNEYIEYYIALIKALSIRKAIGEYIFTAYKSCKVNLAELQELQRRVLEVFADCEDEDKRRVIGKIHDLLTDINTSKGMWQKK